MSFWLLRARMTVKKGKRFDQSLIAPLWRVTCSHSLLWRDLSLVLDLDELVVPVLAGHHPPGEEESEHNEWAPHDDEDKDDDSTSDDSSEDDDGESSEEGVGDEASHADDDSSSVLDGVSTHHVLDHEEVEDDLGQVDKD